MTGPARAFAVLLTLAAGFATGPPARAGSTEPELAVASAAATVEDGVVTLAVAGNFDFANLVRLGYPVAVVLTAGHATARVPVGGTVVVTGPAGATALPAERGVVVLGSDRLHVVVPAPLVPAGRARVRLEGVFDGQPLVSNTVEATW
jgi:hypothetical protein